MSQSDENVSRGFGAGLSPSAEVTGQPQLTRFQLSDRTVTDHDIRCQGKVTLHGEEKLCGKKLADFAGRPWKLTCPRCKYVNVSPVNQSPQAVTHE